MMIGFLIFKGRDALALDCTNPSLEGLGMCVNIAKVRPYLKTQDQILWVELSSSIQAAKPMRAVYNCIDHKIANEANKVLHKRTWTSTAPAIALQNCHAVDQLQRNVKGIAREDAGLFMCGEAYMLLESYIGVGDLQLVSQQIAVCAGLYKQR